MSRLMGLLLTAVVVQFIVNGLTDLGMIRLAGAAPQVVRAAPAEVSGESIAGKDQAQAGSGCKA